MKQRGAAFTAFLCVLGGLALVGRSGMEPPRNAGHVVAAPGAATTMHALQPLPHHAALGRECEASLLPAIRTSQVNTLVGMERVTPGCCHHWRSGTWVAGWHSCWLWQFGHSLIARHVRLQI